MSLAPTATVAPLAAAKTVRVVVRSILAIAAICLVCAATLGGRYLAFEYGHGSSGMASRLFDPLS
jgi:uncharacterized membrane protein